MTRHFIWQAGLAALGIALVFLVLFQFVSTVPVEQPTPVVLVRGGIYVEGVVGYSEAINPILAPRMAPANPVDQDLSALVFEGLTSLDASGQISPSLALDWDVTEDGSVYEFRLRRGVTWHDGAPFSADDVAFTVQAIQDPDYQGDPNLSALWRDVTVYQVDDYTVRFTLGEPFPSFLYYTSIGLLPAHLVGNVPASGLGQHPFSTEKPIGTGMFQVEDIAPDRVVLAVNPSYWGPEPELDGLEFWFYGSWDNLLTDYEQGEVHAFHPPTLDDLSRLVSVPDLQLYSAPTAGYGIVFLNLVRDSVAFFQEQEVRQALLYGLERQMLIDEILAGQGQVAHSPIVPMSWAYDPSARQYGYDPERAVGLLDAVGWMDSNADRIRDRDGADLAFTLLVSDEPPMAQMAESMARQWRTIGIDVEIRSVTSEVANRFVRTRNFDAALVEVDLTADTDPYPLWHSTQAESGQNFAGFQHEESDLIMEEIRSTTDAERQLELYHTFQQIFAEQVPSLLIYYPIYTYAVDSQVEGVQLAPLLHNSDRFRNAEDWYMPVEETMVNTGDALDKTGQ
ncbi:MAG: ABC transporter substrate-binding protein [Anaerolineae bacterium]|nr:ABC transporter substrate-binding protein [Anaerolineae bacterium]